MNLLNKGNKFIPCFFDSHFSYFSFLEHFLRDFLINFNKKTFFFNNSNKNKTITDIPTTNTDETSIQNEDLVIFDNILTKLKKEKNKNSSNKYPLQHETIDLEFFIFNEFNKLKFNKASTNVNIDEFMCLRKFIKTKPFKVCLCDKNVGFSVISNYLYDELSFKHLNNDDNFTKLDENPLESTKDLIKNKLLDLKINNNISNKLFNSLVIKNSKLGTFNILPKIHKSVFSTRPIINCIMHPTANLSYLIDILLQPWVQSSSSYIKDSQNLIQKLEDLTLPNDAKMYSFDFESLYSNINLVDCLNIISDFMKNKIEDSNLNIIGFHHILKLIFENNVFSYKNYFYKQLVGVSMGSKASPSIANIYLYCLEKSFLFIHKPLFYGRYIDDIYAIFVNNFNTNLLVNHFKYLKLNKISSDIINFLDLNIFFDKITNSIKFSLYIKPTQTFSYLLTSSNHPNFITKNIPKGIFIRIRRICSSITDYLYFSNKILVQLKSRGYDFSNTSKMMHTIARLNRIDLLKYKKKVDLSKDNNNVFISNIFDVNFIDFNKLLIPNIKNLATITDYSDYILNKNFIKISRMQPNLGGLTINSIPSFIFNNCFFKYKKCMNNSCRICSYSNDISFLYFVKKNNFFLKVQNNSNCDSNSFVYIIYCNKCKCFYIGESSRKVKERLSEHIRDINNFLPFLRFTSISRHFNLYGHTLNEHFQFFIYDINIVNSFERKYIERKLIYYFQKFKFKLINDDFPSIYSNSFYISV